MSGSTIRLQGDVDFYSLTYFVQPRTILVRKTGRLFSVVHLVCRANLDYRGVPLAVCSLPSVFCKRSPIRASVKHPRFRFLIIFRMQ